MSTNFSFVLSNNSSSNGLLSTCDSEIGLLSDNSNSIGSILTMVSNSDAGFDAFGGKDIFGSFNISDYSDGFFASADSAEVAGSVACFSAGLSIAGGTAETAGSVAYSGGDCGSFSGGGAFSSVC